MTPTREQRNVRERLEQWELRIQRLLALYGSDRKLPVALRAEVRWQYARLKLSLRAEFEAGNRWRNRSQTTWAERHFYHPALHAASAHLIGRIEAGPDAWHRALCNALSAISDAVVLLDEREGKAPPRQWSA
jgi:hypothetical protein